MIDEKQGEEVEEKIKQESDTRAAKIEILYGADNIVKRTIGDFHTITQRFDNCTDYTGPSVFYNTPIWKQSELYEQLQIHDKMQKEFINIAAHELVLLYNQYLDYLKLFYIIQKMQNKQNCYKLLAEMQKDFIGLLKIY